MTDPHELRVGIVGLGFGARVHLPGWRRIPGVSVAAVCARHGAAEVAARARIPRWTDEWRELTDDPDLDVVSIATPPSTHYEIALRALQARKAVLCEKPLATSVDEAEELARLATTPNAVNFSYRAVPAFRRVREQIAAGAIGEVRLVSVRWHVGSRLTAMSWSWKDSREEGGGALAAYGVHSLDYLEWLAGPVAALSASLTIPAEQSSAERVTSDDACALELALESGAKAAIEVSLVEPEHIHSVEIRGARGVLVLENNDARDPVGAFTARLDGKLLHVPRASRARSAGEDPRVEPFAVLASALAGAATHDGAVSPSFSDGARAQRLIEHVHEAFATGQMVRVRSGAGNG